MKSSTLFKIKGMFVLLALIFISQTLTAQTRTYRVTARANNRTIGGQSIHFWYFDVESYQNSEPNGTAPIIPLGNMGRRAPGRDLLLPANRDNLVIVLTNRLPVPTSFMLSGRAIPTVTKPGLGGIPQTVSGVERNAQGRITSLLPSVPAPTAADPNPTYTYTFKNLKPGTFLYRSGTNIQLQVQMGLYGACYKPRSGGNSGGNVYEKKDGSLVPYDLSRTMIFSEIDPGVHAAVESGVYGDANLFPNTLDYRPKIFLINGNLYNPSGTRAKGNAFATMRKSDLGTDTDADLLIRMVNAGLTTRVPTFLGGYWKVISEDGHVYQNAKEQYNVVLPAGKTSDIILNVNNLAVKKYPIFDRRFFRSTAGTTKSGKNGGLAGFVQVNN